MKLVHINESIRGNLKPIAMAGKAMGSLIRYLDSIGADDTLDELNTFFIDRDEQSWNRLRGLINQAADNLSADEDNRYFGYADEIRELSTLPAQIAIAASYDIPPPTARGTKAVRTAVNNRTRREVKRAMGPNGFLNLTSALGDKTSTVRPERQKQIFKSVADTAQDARDAVQQVFRGAATRRQQNF